MKLECKIGVLDKLLLDTIATFWLAVVLKHRSVEGRLQPKGFYNLFKQQH